MMNNDFRKLLEQLEEYDREVTQRFWLYPVTTVHEMDFKEWRDFVLSSYGNVSDSYAKKVYESIVYNKETRSSCLVQLRLCDVFNKVEGTSFEKPLRRAIMKCVYAEHRFDREIRPIMDAYYSEKESEE